MLHARAVGLKCFRFRWLGLAVCLVPPVSIAPVTHAEAQGIYIEYQGLQANDEFDAVLLRVFGCADETLKKMIADSNKRRSDGKSTPVPNCPVEDALK